MYKIDWNSFKVKNENYTQAFEDLSYRLFCRKHNFPEGIKADFNQAGLETYPKKSYATDLNVGFQSKFFDNGTDYKQIKKSIEKALNEFGDFLDEITIYLNTNTKLSSKSAQEIKQIASSKNVHIDWFTQSQFTIALNQPTNLDLAQLFFGRGDEHGFLKSNLIVDDYEFLESPEFITLPVIDLNTNKKSEIELNDKLTLLTGNPGSGKSVLVKSIFLRYATISESFPKLDDNSSLPMLVNLKDCYSGSLEDLIRQRQNDYLVRNKNIKFIYLLDGLDELSEVKTDITLRYIKQLSEISSTKNILLSCRKGSLNRLKVNEYFHIFKRYEIDQLSVEFVDLYFSKKNNSVKNNKLQLLKKNNQKLLSDISDIFLVKLLWDTIEDLTEKSTIIDILEIKVYSLLKGTEHKSNLATLNLLNPKEEAIIMLNEVISYRFSKKYQYRFNHSSLAKILLRKLPNLDYESLNKILHYIVGAFFDAGDGTEQSHMTYIYQHRRYQEYFFARRLKKKFENDMKIIRSKGIILDTDFFEDIFIKYLENEYRKTNNLSGLVLLKSIGVYSKNGDHWYISESDQFIPNLSYQNEKTLEVLLNDDILNTKEHIQSSYRNALFFYEHNNAEYAGEMVLQISKKDWGIKDIEGQVFSLIKIKKVNSYSEFFLKKYRDYCVKINDDINVRLDNQTNQEYAYKSYFKVGLKHLLSELVALIPDLNNNEIFHFLELLSSKEYLPIFFHNHELRSAISIKIKPFRVRANAKNLSLFFFKKVLGFNITEKNLSDIFATMILYQDRINSYNFKRYIHYFALVCFIGGEEYFIEKMRSNSFSAEDDVIKYCALFGAYIHMLQAGGPFSKTLVIYSNRFKNWYRSKSNPKDELSKLWSYIFYYAKGTNADYHRINNMHDFAPFVFLEFVNKIDQSYFSDCFSEAELEDFEKGLVDWKDDYASYIDRCFLLSGMYSKINSNKSINYIKQAFINSKLRHGWRKDIYISEYLNDAFGQILDKKWFSKAEVKDLSKRLFELNLKLYDITDRDHTRYGILEFLKAISRYDISMAYDYHKRFRNLELDDYVENLSLVAILKNDIKQNALAYDVIDKKLSSYHFKDKHYDQKIFSVLMEVIKSEFYDEQAKQSAFIKAFNIVHKVEGKFDYQKDIIRKYYTSYNSFCKLNEVINIISTDLDESDTYNDVSPEQFSLMIDHINNKSELKALYEFYDNYKNKIIIKDKTIWRKWIDKTLSVDKNINRFTKLITKRGFLQSGFWHSHNSDYLHIGVACCLDNINSKVQMENCLVDIAGYGAFYKLIYVYKEMNDKKTSRELFDKYLQFCDFLVN